MYTQNSNRAWKRALAQKPCNRAARRNAARIVALHAAINPAPAVIVETAPQIVLGDEAPTSGRVYTRPYVITEADGARRMLRSAKTPEGFLSVMGPFKTTRGAQFVLNNPGDHTVATAERHAADFERYLNR